MSTNPSSQDSTPKEGGESTFRFADSTADSPASEPSPEEVAAINQQMRDIADVAALIM